jgi:DNA-binding SARP family transcriptional activator
MTSRGHGFAAFSGSHDTIVHPTSQAPASAANVHRATNPGAVDVEFLVLGPVQVNVAGRPLTIASNNQRVVLAMLLLESGRAVPVSRLVDAIWEDDPPYTARNQVQLSVSQLRKRFSRAGVSELVVTDPAGYLVGDLGGSLDLRRFQQLVSSAAADADRRPAAAVAQYRAALELWRGDAVGDIASQIVQQAAARLNESRLAAQEACVDLELRLGRQAQVVGELTELVARYPWRDRFRAQLMVSLYRSGRQADALEVARTGRKIMREELGLDPGNELRALEEAILAGDSALDPPDQSLAKIIAGGPQGELSRHAAADGPRLGPVPAPQQLPPAVAGFAGRGDLLAQIRRALVPPDGRTDGLIRLVALTGRGGTGKTALAVHAAHEIRDAFPDGILFAEFRDEGGPARNPARVLEGFLRTFGIAPAAVPDDVASRAAMYRSWLAGKRVLIVLDDVPDADQAQLLLPGTPGCAVIITSRDRMTRLPGAIRLNVGPIDERSGAELLAWAIGQGRADAESDAIRGLVALCEGLPLALRIAGSKLAERRHWTVEQMRRRLADEQRRLDELDLGGTSVRATLAFSYRSLPEELRRLLRRLSMLGATDIPYWVAAAVMDVEPYTAEDMLAELVSAQLLEARTAADGTVRYQMHDLVLIYAAEMLARDEPEAERHAVLQRYVGCWLALAERAHGLLVGGDFEILHGNAPRWTLPDGEMDKLLAEPARWFGEELENLRRTALLAARAGLDDACWDLTLTLSTVFESGGYSAGWREVHEMAKAAAENAGNRLGVAATLFSLGHVTLMYGLDESADHLRRAMRIFDQLGHRHGQGLVLRDLASADRQAGRHAVARSRYENALACLQDAGDITGQISVLRNLARIEMDRINYPVADELLVQAIALGRQIGARRSTMQARCQLSELHRRSGDPEQAERLLWPVLSYTQESGDLVGQAYSLLGLGRALADQGDLGRAENKLRAATDLADRAGNAAVRGETRLALAGVEFMTGRLDLARARVAEALELFEHLGSVLWRARCLELSGRLHERSGQTEDAVRMWHLAVRLAGNSDAELRRRLENHLRAEAAGGADSVLS